MNLRDNYKIFQPNIKESTFYSEAHENFSNINHMLGPQTNLKNTDNFMHPIWPVCKNK